MERLPRALVLVLTEAHRVLARPALGALVEHTGDRRQAVAEHEPCGSADRGVGSEARPEQVGDHQHDRDPQPQQPDDRERPPGSGAGRASTPDRSIEPGIHHDPQEQGADHADGHRPRPRPDEIARFLDGLRRERRCFGPSARANPKPFPSQIRSLCDEDGFRLAAVTETAVVGLIRIGLTISTTALGVEVANLDGEERKARGVEGEGGVIVRKVTTGPLAAAGVQANDVILTLNHVAIRDAAHFGQVASSLPKGKHVPLYLVRDGSPSFLPLKID